MKLSYLGLTTGNQHIEKVVTPSSKVSVMPRLNRGEVSFSETQQKSDAISDIQKMHSKGCIDHVTEPENRLLWYLEKYR